MALPIFWSLVLGTAVSLLLEREGWKRPGSEGPRGPRRPVDPDEEGRGTVGP